MDNTWNIDIARGCVWDNDCQPRCRSSLCKPRLYSKVFVSASEPGEPEESWNLARMRNYKEKCKDNEKLRIHPTSLSNFVATELWECACLRYGFLLRVVETRRMSCCSCKHQMHVSAEEAFHQRPWFAIIC